MDAAALRRRLAEAQGRLILQEAEIPAGRRHELRLLLASFQDCRYRLDHAGPMNLPQALDEVRAFLDRADRFLHTAPAGLPRATKTNVSGKNG